MLIIEAKQRKHEEEEAEALRIIEEGRREQREKEDEELRRLKEKQVEDNFFQSKILYCRKRWHRCVVFFTGSAKERTRGGRTENGGAEGSDGGTTSQRRCTSIPEPLFCFEKNSKIFDFFPQEARKQKAEEDKLRKMEEAERKKAAAQAAMSGGRNFTIENKEEGQNTIDKV